MPEQPKPRLRLASDEELPEHLRGRSDLVRVFGHNARAFDAWNQWYRLIIRDGALPARLKEMMRLRVAQMNACDF